MNEECREEVLSFEECVGKSTLKQGQTWPEGFCLMCKGTGKSFDLHRDRLGKCRFCNGTGRVDWDALREKAKAAK